MRISRLDVMQKKFDDLESKVVKNIWPKLREHHDRLGKLDRALASVADLSQKNTQVITDANVIATRNELENFIRKTDLRFQKVFKPEIVIGKRFEQKLDTLQRQIRDNENKAQQQGVRISEAKKEHFDLLKRVDLMQGRQTRAEPTQKQLDDAQAGTAQRHEAHETKVESLDKTISSLKQQLTTC